MFFLSNLTHHFSPAQQLHTTNRKSKVENSPTKTKKSPVCWRKQELGRFLISLLQVVHLIPEIVEKLIDRAGEKLAY